MHPSGRWEGRMRCRGAPATIVCYPRRRAWWWRLTLAEIGPEPLSRLKEVGTTDTPLEEDGARAIGPVGASGSTAQTPALTPKRPAASPYSGCSSEEAIKR